MAGRLKKMFKQKNEKKASCSVVVAAAGSSSRMDGPNKLFLEIGGMPVLAHTLTVLEKSPVISEIIIVTRPMDLDTVAKLCSEYAITKLSKIIVGGKTRLESVYNGVLQVSDDAQLIAVHDGARPFVTEKIIAEAVEAALKYTAAAPAVPVVSTLKQAANGIVEKTVDRNNLFEIQTPQIFVAEIIKGALQNAVNQSLYITDDCMAVEAIGCPVKLTAGSRENIKLTTAEDVSFAEAIYLARKEKFER